MPADTQNLLPNIPATPQSQLHLQCKAKLVMLGTLLLTELHPMEGNAVTVDLTTLGACH